MILDRLIDSSVSAEDLSRNIDCQLTNAEEQVIQMMEKQVREAQSNKKQAQLSRPVCRCRRKANAAGANKDTRIGSKSLVEQGFNVLQMMKDGMKPTLIVIGNLQDQVISASHINSSFEKGLKLFDEIEGLCFKDCKLIAVDLSPEVSNLADGHATSDQSDWLCDYKLLAYMTQGCYLNMRQLSDLDWLSHHSCTSSSHHL